MMVPLFTFSRWVVICSKNVKLIGLYAENHGILNNHFYDIENDLEFNVMAMNTVRRRAT